MSVQPATPEQLEQLSQLKRQIFITRKKAMYLKAKAMTKLPILETQLAPSATQPVKLRIARLQNAIEIVRADIGLIARADVVARQALRARAVELALNQRALIQHKADLQADIEVLPIKLRQLDVQKKILEVWQRKRVQELWRALPITKTPRGVEIVHILWPRGAPPTTLTELSASLGYILQLLRGFITILDLPEVAYRILSPTALVRGLDDQKFSVVMEPGVTLEHLGVCIAALLWRRGVVISNLDTVLGNFTRLMTLEGRAGPHNFSQVVIDTSLATATATFNPKNTPRSGSPTKRPRINSIHHIRPAPLASVAEEASDLEKDWKIV
jgi:hypothetical protein